jgi:hypothetical protein
MKDEGAIFHQAAYEDGVGSIAFDDLEARIR